MKLINFILNDKEVSTNEHPGTILLDFIRYHKQLTGTKIGCREGDCGACTVLIGDNKGGEMVYGSYTSCLTPIGNVNGKHIVTIEGVNIGESLNVIQQAMVDSSATQCGFCTPGFVMSLAGFCLNKAEPTNENAIASIDGNICRCTGYKSIERAAEQVAGILRSRNNEEPATFAVKNNILPGYFETVKEKVEGVRLKVEGVERLEVKDQSQKTRDNERFEMEGLRRKVEGDKIVNHNSEIVNQSHNPQQKTDNPQQTTPYFLGGGTDLYVQKHDEMKEANINFMYDNASLKEIKRDGNKCIIGASTTVADLQQSPIMQEYFPYFERYVKLVSSTPIRNMATIAGNFTNASPIGDFTIFFLALNAKLILTDGLISREMPLRQFYKGYKQLDKKPAEYIKSIWFELPDKQTQFNFEKVSKRTNLDIASVNSAICISMEGDTISDAHISAGGVGPTPKYLAETSHFLHGKKVSDELISSAIETAQKEISPISDARGTEMYKRLLLGQLIKAHFMVLFPEKNLELV